MPKEYANLKVSSQSFRKLEEKFSRLCKIYAFDEMITPTIEFSDLYSRSAGETSDVVRKEMFRINTESDSLVLRPEGTAGVIRSYVQNKMYVSPNETARLFYKGSMFRYEHPQAGRQREFTQFGVEAIGAEDPCIDAEVISLSKDFFDSLGIKNFELQINSIGCKDCRNRYKQKLVEYLSCDTNWCEDCLERIEKNPMRVLDCKNEVCKEKLQNAPMITQFLCDDCRKDYEKLKNTLAVFNVRYTENPKLVRGLDYYSKTAFEFISNDLGAQRTFCGGGRYSGLVSELGGPEVSGVGFAIGVERLLMILEKQNLLENENESLDYFLVWTNEETKEMQMKVLQSLRKKGFRAEMEMCKKKMKSSFKTADRKNAKNVVIIAEDELARNVAAIKEMDTGTQSEISIDEFLK